MPKRQQSELPSEGFAVYTKLQLPRREHGQLKAWAASKGMHLSGAVTELVRRHVAPELDEKGRK